MRAVPLTPVAAVVATVLVSASALEYETIVTKIPNGDSVPGLKALGPTFTVKSATSDPFILALQRTKFTWTAALCKADSDGDGQTNGQELGDPCCSWVETRNLASIRDISDPGDPTSKSNLAVYQFLQCTKSEEAVAAAGKTKKTRAPATTKPRAATNEDADTDASSTGSSGNATSSFKPSGQQGSSSRITSGAAVATITATSVGITIAAAWALLV